MMSFFLIPLYCIGIQCERGGWWRICYLPAAIGLVIDVVANYTELAVLTFDFPKRGEWTFSTRLARLQYEQGRRGEFARYVGGCLDKIAPSGKHIKTKE